MDMKIKTIQFDVTNVIRLLCKLKIKNKIVYLFKFWAISIMHNAIVDMD